MIKKGKSWKIKAWVVGSRNGSLMHFTATKRPCERELHGNKGGDGKKEAKIV